MRRAAAVLLVLLATAATAHAGDPDLDAALEQARREKAGLRYPEALATLERALRLGRATPAELREIYRNAGELAAGLDDEAAATAHFQRWLALDPTATLPEGTSPKIQRPFDAARAWLAAHAPLVVRFEIAPGALVLIVDSDPLAMVAGGRARVRADGAAESELAAKGTTRVELRLPAGRRLLVVAAAVDSYGNELTVHGSWEVPIVVESRTGGSGAPAPRRPLYARWWVWGVTGVALGGAGLVLGDRMNAAQDEFDEMKRMSGSYTLEETRAVATRGKRYAFAANASFIASGAAGVAAVVLLVRDSYDDDDVIVTPTASPSGGVGFVLSGSF